MPKSYRRCERFNALEPFPSSLAWLYHGKQIRSRFWECVLIYTFYGAWFYNFFLQKERWKSGLRVFYREIIIERATISRFLKWVTLFFSFRIYLNIELFFFSFFSRSIFLIVTRLENIELKQSTILRCIV
jgi:hypothetical protein